ncbi:MAG: hypothetical protein QXL09_01850 [Candidatus Aenigmatarchaeota archaeon]
MGFKAVLDDLSTFRDSIATISEIIEETQIKIKKNGIELIASDRAVVAVVDFKFSAKNFREYNYESDLAIGINLANLLQILKRARSSDITEFLVSDNKFIITLKGESTRRFSIPLLDIREEIPQGIEKLVFPVKLEISSSALEDGIEDADLVSDALTFEVTKDALILKAEGDSSSSELIISKDKAKFYGEKNAKATYSLDYLKKMIKGRKISENVIIEFDTNYPMRMTFERGSDIALSFILAPRIEEE